MDAGTIADPGAIPALVARAGEARARVVAAASEPGVSDGAWSPSAGAWSVQAIVEHLVLAEQAGVQFIWRAAEAVRTGQPLWIGDPVHRGLPIEAVIARTWRFREEAPPNATPQAAVPLPYWRASLAAQQPVLAALGQALAGLDLEAVIYPHFISGPLDARQRLEFIRWHIEHHARQLDEVIAALHGRSP